ncbi:hypothetical protein ONZ45_g11039 [Pleurotus djamor]|nr:hypothetical protein ONZ45_g11039 [Pleurotus djamor]
MSNTLCPDPLTDSLEYLKFVVARQADRSAFFWNITAIGLFNDLPGGGPRFVFTPNTTLSTHLLENAFRSPVVLLDSCMNDNPQLNHTLQSKKLAFEYLNNPSVVSEAKAAANSRGLYNSNPGANPVAILFEATYFEGDLSTVRRGHRGLVLDALRSLETVVLIAKAIHLQDFVYMHSGNQVEKLNTISETQLYCVFFAFLDFVARIKPTPTYHWLKSVFASIVLVATLACDHIPSNGEPSPRSPSLGKLLAGRCQLCDEAKL